MTHRQVGSILEEDHEQGIAHLIEHLAFRGSRSDAESFAIVREVRLHASRTMPDAACIMALALSFLMNTWPVLPP